MEYFPQIIEEPVRWGSKGNYPTGKYKALVDAGTGKLFSIVTNGYRLIRHEKAIEEVDRAIDRIPALGNAGIITTEFFNDGGRMRRTYRFQNKAVEIAKGDLVNLELHLFNSHDLTWPFTALLGAFRLVCTNGLVVEEKLLQVKKRHVFELDKMGLEAELSSACERFSAQTQEWKGWVDRHLTEITYTKVMETMQFGKEATGVIEEQVDQKASDKDKDGFPVITLWAFYNILTWYITFKAVSLNHRVEMERRLRAAMDHLKGK